MVELIFKVQIKKLIDWVSTTQTTKNLLTLLQPRGLLQRPVVIFLFPGFFSQTYLDIWTYISPIYLAYLFIWFSYSPPSGGTKMKGS